ncbi:MAG: methylmalonyl-CoA mutase family protein [candidate division WOR-3 bacterium]|jgi:methylmalonyl-CoA mutase N-terminal domain/subunit|nr:methylmalonyl-CoA mutase family protein [candidate division WOR-3 bacterium]MCR4422975.1 methylmalonyl-CoA mutase family protein [candidate division WOR-3 bacterium]MDH7518314.1 methylmalonyl-CoA mutase family protein [bacterium]
MKQGKDDLKRAIELWEENVLNPALKKAPELKDEWTTVSGIPLKRVYTPLEWEGEDYLAQQGLPGSFPFTRGVQPTMYRSRLWTMRQYAGFGSAEETNARYHYLLQQGQTGLSVAFDLPTQMGYDSDHPMARGEVGKVGVAISTIEDMARLFAGIPLDRVSTSMTINATAAILLAMYCVVAERQGVDWKKLQGTIQNDVLKEYVARGTYIFPPRPSLRLVTDIIAWCAGAVPKWNTISISGYHIREAGATAVEEVAFTLANGLEYVKAAQARGLEVDRFAPRLSFFFAAHTNIFEEVAKFRAARRLWARLLKERFGASDESCKLRFHTQTGGVTLTAQQPENNVIRVAYQALAAVLGGTQSLHTNSRDEALSLPTEESVTIALRTQQILAYETGVTDTVDPLAGSYFIESLTDEIERRARALIDEIVQRGGAVSAIEQGFIQERIAESAWRYQREVEEGKRIVVGVNRFSDAVEPKLRLLRVDEALAEKRRQELADFRARRDAAAVQRALVDVERVARSEENLMPVIVAAVRANATVGEISDALRTVFGEYDRERR